jgi:hypothetical protein
LDLYLERNRLLANAPESKGKRSKISGALLVSRPSAADLLNHFIRKSVACFRRTVKGNLPRGGSCGFSGFLPFPKLRFWESLIHSQFFFLQNIVFLFLGVFRSFDLP